MGTLIDRFEDHDGPVRGVDFHPTQPIFVSGGDDATIRVWSLVTRKCLFVLNGHLDYVRTVFFHNELPWIISASDDQTIRIWNWQNRQEIACLAGHNNYVMCAQFHPTEDLIVSASLDASVRVWDISGLRKKHSAPSSTIHSFEDQMNRGNSIPQQDIFGNTDAIVKYVLEGHDRGVNWAAFHPRLPLVVSGGDDRVLKIWRMTETKAWEVDTCRGHTNNISCCLFDPHQDLIISVGEDKTIRTWDLNKRTPVQLFKRESDRFWLLASHPNINLFGSCHDSGVMVFKLNRERPASSIFQNTLFYVNKEKQVKLYNFNNDEDSLPILSLKKIGSTWNPIRSLSYNPAERSILIINNNEYGNEYSIATLPQESNGPLEPSDLSKGSGDAAVFIARNRFAVFNKTNQTIDIKDLSNAVTKTIKLTDQINDIAYAGPGTLLLLGTSTVTLYDVQQKKSIAETALNGIKYTVWSFDGQYLALLGKHTITITNKKLQTICSLHETIRIKSAIFDDTGVLLYSTLNHIKYTLLNGDSGIIKTLKETVYLTKVKSNKVYCLTREGTIELIIIDPTEYRFKKALINKNFIEVLRIIKNSNLVGKNIISYLEKKGYPEIALQFVEDPLTRFELALECGNLDVALEEATKLNTDLSYEKLGKAALIQGNTSIVELVYQHRKQFTKLSFLYLINGEEEKLKKMEKIADFRGDLSSIIQNSIYLNNHETRIDALIKAGQPALAYSLAKTNGLDERAAKILEDEGINEEDINLPTLGGAFTTPTIKIPSPVINWPLKPSALSFFEQAVLGQVDDLTLSEAPKKEEKEIVEDTTGFFGDEMADAEEAEIDESGWDLDEDLEIENEGGEDQEDDAFDEATGAAGEIGHWLRNSKTAAGHVAAGSFDTAAQLLNRQLGIVNFEPLRKRFLEVYEASRVYLPATEGLPPLNAYIRANRDTNDVNQILPVIPGYESLPRLVHEGLKLFRKNNLVEAIEVFRQLIYTIAVISVSTQEEVDDCKSKLQLAKEYILGLSIELERRGLGPDDVKRNLELAAYFTKVKLQPEHRQLSLQTAMQQSYKQKNYASASYFANELLKSGASKQRHEQAQKIKQKSDRTARDTIEIDFDPYGEFDICASTHTPIYKGDQFVSDALTGAKYLPSEKGKLCSITKITAIGAPASGLRILD